MKATICGLILLAAAAVMMLITEDLGIVQFLLMLVGGWCLGFAFVNLTFRMPRNGLFLHIAVAVVLTAVMIVVTEFGSRLLQGVPEAAAGVIVVLQMAAIPATGWILLALIGRMTDAIGRRDRRRRPAPVAPEWQRDESGDGSVVSVNVIEFRMSQVTRAIIVIVLAVSIIGVALLIAFDEVVGHIGVRVSIVALGLVLGLPAYAVLSAMLRRRTVPCTIALGNDEIRIRVADAASVIRFADLDHLRWRCGSDYARVEVRGGGVDLSLFTGLAKPEPGTTRELPPLPRRVFTRLERYGLTLRRSRRGDVVTFARAVS